MKIAGIVIGSILVLIGLSSIPSVIADIGKQSDAHVAGQFTCVGCEAIGGLLLIVSCARGLIREGKYGPRNVRVVGIAAALGKTLAIVDRKRKVG